LIFGYAQSSNKQRTLSGSSGTPNRNLAIGVRLGDPLGITVKKYLPQNRAIELSIGRSSYWGYNYRDGFYDNDKFSGYDYVDYEFHNSISIQAHYLFQKNIPSVKALQWYWGAGPQLRFKKYEYYYRFRDLNGNWVYERQNVTNIDFGGDVVIGLEYRIPKSLLSVFADANLLVEIFDDPFRFYGQGGIGCRYSIK